MMCSLATNFQTLALGISPVRSLLRHGSIGVW